MFGGTGFALFGALHYWFPKMFGKMYNKPRAVVGWLLMTVGFHVLYFPMFIMGYMGMPRRYYHYLPEFQSLHQLSTVGSWIMVAGILLVIVNLVLSLKNGEKAPANPWNGRTLEWTVSSPPPTENFHTIPTVTTGPYDYSEYEKPSSERS
jgi:cytochrome c oxidase subunit 1